MKNIKVIGYYGHHNLGDEQYKITFKRLFANYTFIDTVQFIDCDVLLNTEINEEDIIVLGGGDILNNYFIDKVIAKFYDKPNKVIGISVGLPYTDILENTTKLSIIDHIFIRSYQDLPLFSKYFDPHRIQCIPDLAYYLLDSKSNKRPNRHKNKRIGISLSRSIYNPQDETGYNANVNSFVYFCRYLLARNFDLTFVSFNTNGLNNSENDILIHTHIMTELRLITPRALMNNVQHIIERNTQEVFNEWGTFDYTICMKFHACIFSIYNNTPFLPVYTTRKVDNLMKDLGYEVFYQLPVDSRDIPTEIKIETLVNKFIELEKNAGDIKDRLYLYNQNFVNQNMTTCVQKLQDVLLNPCLKNFEMLGVPYKIKNTYRKTMEFITSKGYSQLFEVSDPIIQETVVKLVSYNLCNTTDSQYNWGLQEKMFKKGYNHEEEWRWILRDQNKIIPNNPYGLFNLTFIDQEDYAKVHRSGWQYVYENITYLHNSNADLLLDLYLDKTFGWNSEINSILGIIPYVSDWIGFIHHTFDTSFSKNNVYTLLDNPLFIQSLRYCKGLFVLSEYLKTQLEQELRKLGIHTNVYSITHPVEDVPLKFSYNAFLENNERSIVHIGGWLRNIYNYYSIIFPRTINERKCLFSKKEYLLYKKAIKGKLMNNYYPEDDFLNKLTLLLSNSKGNCFEVNSANCSSGTPSNCSLNCSANSSANCSSDCYMIKNNWYNHFYRDIVRKVNSVQVIECVTNEEYDDILSKNIVFLNLVDASAVNTILECIVRNTPILINKIPPVVELLGDSYPLYYTSHNYIEMSQEIKELLTSKNIRRAHRYLERMDKRFLSINTFITRFTEIVKKLKN